MHRILTYALDTTDLAPDLAQEIRGREDGRIANRIVGSRREWTHVFQSPEQENDEKMDIVRPRLASRLMSIFLAV
jgi:hypothetical protein